MTLTQKIRKQYGSVKSFCEEYSVNYASFRVNLLLRKILYPKAVNALIKANIVSDERELRELLYSDTQAKNLMKNIG